MRRPVFAFMIILCVFVHSVNTAPSAELSEAGRFSENFDGLSSIGSLHGVNLDGFLSESPDTNEGSRSLGGRPRGLRKGGRRVSFVQVDEDEKYGKLPSNVDDAGRAPHSIQIGVRPNILVFVVDDLGRGDLSYTEGSLQTPTPNIDKFAWDGIILDRHYSNPTCSPTRTAFISGKYPFHTGMQVQPISAGEPWGMPLEFKLLPQFMKELGYATYHIGKWHLGEHMRAFYPENRGFDRAYYITAGEANWFNYTVGWITPMPVSGRNLRDQGKAVWANITQNVYLPHLLNDRAVEFIRTMDPGKPFFMHFSTPLVHTAIDLYQSAMHTMAEYQLRPPVYTFTEQFPERKRCLGLIQALDESFKKLTDALINKGLINNTIIAFFSDNGAPMPQTAFLTHGSNHGSNWPLRHGKGSLFEGGVRVPAFIWSDRLRKRSRIMRDLFHVVDWLPTFYEAAGGDPRDLEEFELDGRSHWRNMIGATKKEARSELVLNADPVRKSYSLIHKAKNGVLYKVISGPVLDNSFTGWFRPEGTRPDSESWREPTPLSINCNALQGKEIRMCRPWKAPCLFDLRTDPCETNNIADSYKDMLNLLLDKLRRYNATVYPSQMKPFDPTSNPVNWGGWFVPWKDAKPFDEEPLTFMPFTPSDAY